ncbi:MAG: hypothetical protein COZ37_01555 [bacterium (Candidatus Ratteibacteria) CG_4_10_14_3_um_filter_41_18]|uniref:HTH arsR-type domain-containing protein n=4 Tax=Candidatus Ratteibacteria TaxID=2979319 RepID=A0A2M7EAK1_9BACT|nr:MAG: hypothetical protein AUJ76_03895 [Candidatus Omnitrophica bacterium CG1_02_41_171]PIV64763.1 MAG: hypothetical protein COS11_00490 [bacterium (Candidatus Ratteibacteria) CG01_land_8_20_14_3_00_40_19]PIW33658.1 MAG: hypothetical protein COW28_03435 [bacterium (Candidatus Ratteibacteria) CG15_BIG_FIL_POST_REV_8_21_14_020_41_12]PIW74284.1 MAG: hypothetical protein CO004_01465 [bacterium (Candidatus Ratteibacteria) CG_4_8_14_3_um_filter_41_36]PIX77658.1 MAG: hypothetical protein COZ37_01555
MKLHYPLDKILNNEVKVKILRFFCKTAVEWSGRQIAKEIGINPVTCHKALRELNNEGVLLLRSVGKSYLYRLNEENFIVSDLLKPLYERENKILKEIYKTIVENINSLVINNIVSIALFGSVQKRKERPGSDIDILVLVGKEKDKIKTEKNFEKVNGNIVRKFGNTVSLYIQTAREFKLKYRKDIALIKDILKSYKLVFGRPLEELV